MRDVLMDLVGLLATYAVLVGVLVTGVVVSAVLSAVWDLYRGWSQTRQIRKRMGI